MTTTTDETPNPDYVPYWAISSIGYGSGNTPEEAFQVYIDTQVRNFPNMTRDEILDQARGQVMKAPEGATGFVTGFEDSWTHEDGNPLQEFDYTSEVVAWIGVLPPWAAAPRDGHQKRMATLPVLR